MFTLGPFNNSVTVTKSDTTPVNCTAIYIGGAGNLSIKHTAESATVVYTAPPVGTVLNLHLKNGRIMAATTATNIIAMS